MNKINIFVASGNELKEERKETIQVIHELRKIFPNLNLEAVQWETDLPTGNYNGKKIQEEINPLMEQCDIVLVLFFSKLGRFTLAEYRLACEKHKKVFLFFKTGFSSAKAAEVKEYLKVTQFREHVEKESTLLFKEYESLEGFKRLLKDQLSLHLSREYGRIQDSEEKRGTVPVHQRILQGSRVYYEALTGENGRFRMLHIEDLILSRTDTKDKWVPQPVSGGDEEFNKDETVITLLPRLWKQSRKHAVIVGEGGMGKTVSLVRLWETLLIKSFSGGSGPRGAGSLKGQSMLNETPCAMRPAQCSHPLTAGGNKNEPAPVFIALNEFNQVKEEERKGFILNYIRENYCDSSTSIEEIWDAMKQPVEEGTFKPRMVLLLDGFNEITVEKKELLLEIKRIMEQCPGTRIVLTSRFDMRGQYQWGNWNLVRPLKLEKNQVESYLQEKKLGIPGKTRFLQLIGNPMMLTLYAATCEVQNKNRESQHCRFKDRVESVGELLWNFMEAQVGNLPERLGEDRKKIYYYKFLLKFFLPALGFEMEKVGLFDFTNAQINGHIDFICQRFSQADFFDTYAEFDEYFENLPLGGCDKDSDRRKRAAKLKRIFCEELHMLVREGESYRFLHQDFRDFFAAVHLLNEIKMGIANGRRIPEVMKERCLSVYVRRMMAETEGEQYAKPYVVKGEGWKSGINKGNMLHGLLDCCRGKYGEEVGYVVWNVVRTWQEVRGELSGADLSRLDLSRLVLNGVRCSRLYGGIGGRYLGTVFDGSRIHETNLFPQGHTNDVISVVYSPEGDKILSASRDNTVKEWDAATGECLCTLEGHTDDVNSAVYSPEGDKIVSASDDHTIKEWSSSTGECLRTIGRHKMGVTSAVYSPAGDKIVSASRDHTIKEWDAATGECLRTLEGHTSAVESAVYSPEGDKILSASADESVKEWDAATGECLRTLEGHINGVNKAVYSPEGDRIVSASWDDTVKEWDVTTGECLCTLEGHTKKVTSAEYSPSGDKIVSASWDDTVKEWDPATDECLQTLEGHTDDVTSTVYSPSGDKIASASRDNTVKEWDTATGECLQTLEGHTSYVNSAMYSPSGDKIVSTSFDETIKEWDAATGECLRTMEGHTEKVTSAEYSPSGDKIVSASFDKTVKEWDTTTGECLHTLEGHTNAVNSAVYSPSGNKIVSASFDKTVKEWDTATGECLHTLKGHMWIVDSALYSPSGDKIVSTSYGPGEVKEWDTTTGECLKTHRIRHNPDLSEYHSQSTLNKKLQTHGNEIYLPVSVRNQGYRTLLYIPGLWIHGCSFKNLEKNSQLSKKALELMKQYGARF